MTLASFFFGQPAKVVKAPAERRRVATSPSALRRELASVALRDTLIRHGIPSTWISVELMPLVSSGREPLLYVRLQMKHWEPLLMPHLVPLQNSFKRRVLLLDPSATTWIRGISWQILLADESQCPPMPPPNVWKGPTVPSQVFVAASTSAVSAPPSRKTQRDELEKLLVIGDESAPRDFQNTMPFEYTEADTGLRRTVA